MGYGGVSEVGVLIGLIVAVGWLGVKGRLVKWGVLMGLIVGPLDVNWDKVYIKYNSIYKDLIHYEVLLKSALLIY